MKVRLRQHLEQMLLDAKAPDDRLERGQNALNDLEMASISTFHSFAVSLLKERPIEAGLDPRFTALDDMRSELFFREVWATVDRPRVDRTKSGPGESAAERLPARGPGRSGPDTASSLASIRGLQCDSPPSGGRVPGNTTWSPGCGKQLLRLLLDPKDKLAGILEDALNWLEHPADDGMNSRNPGGRARRRTGPARRIRYGRCGSLCARFGNIAGLTGVFRHNVFWMKL